MRHGTFLMAFVMDYFGGIIKAPSAAFEDIRYEWVRLFISNQSS